MYITGIVQNHRHKMLAIHCMPDHTHMLVGLRPVMAISDLVQQVKEDSSKWINKKGWMLGRFRWQEGYGAFSYGHSQVNQVIGYILNQEKHHAVRSFKTPSQSVLSP
jgi:REP element-mobilizing transposase RayT